LLASFLFDAVIVCFILKKHIVNIQLGADMVTKFELRIPYGKALKKLEKERINQEIIDAFQSVGDTSARIDESYYESKHAAVEVITYVITVISISADICTIALAIREFLKREEKTKEIKIKTDVNATEILIKGNLSDEEIRRIVAEGRKISESKSQKRD
jgi:hypothetical protein